MERVTQEEIKQFLKTLDEIVNSGGTWREKRAQLLAECTEADEENLAEFSEWDWE